MFISFLDVVRVLAMGIGAVAVVFLVIALNHFIGFFKRVNVILDANRASIDSAINALPASIENLNGAVKSINEFTKKAGMVAGSVDNVVSNALSVVSNTTAGILSLGRTAGEAAKYSLRLFNRKSRETNRNRATDRK